MITHLHVENFRILRNVDLDLGPLNFLVGPNGSGKSTVLTVLADLWRGETLLRGRSIGLATDAVIRARCDAVIRNYNFTYQGSGGLFQPWTTRIVRSPGDFNEQLVTDFLRAIHSVTLDAHAARQPVLVTPTQHLDWNAGNLAAFLDSTRDNDESRFKAIERDLLLATDMFDAIGFDRPEDGKKAIKLRIVGTKDFIPIAAASEGTVLLLALFALAHQPTPPSVLCIEEPERGIHPRLYPMVKEALLRLAFPRDFGDDRAPVQVVATTHSPYLLNQFQDHPEFITVCERDPEKGAVFRNLAKDERAKAVLEESVLGDAWVAGTLGGVPLGS